MLVDLVRRRSRLFGSLNGRFDVLGVFGRHGILPVQPPRQIQVGAALRTERTRFGVCVFAADGTAHVSTSLRESRSRLRCNSTCPSGVHPTNTVSTLSRFRAARSALSIWRRSFLAVGAGSMTICPPSPRSRNWRGRSFTAAELALR